MKGTIGLEYIGANSFDALRQMMRVERAMGITPTERVPQFGPVVLEIFRESGGPVLRREVHGQRDYSRANSKGSRGIYVWYTLQQDRLYWIREPKSWRATDCYFAALTSAGSIYRLSQAEAEEWLSAL